MSRVGKKPVPVPAGVTATVTGQTVKMKGSKGDKHSISRLSTRYRAA